MKDYKAIWNNLSTTFADASFYVCCIEDEDDIRRNGAITAEFLASVLQIDPSDRVLEIGCGVARIGHELAARCGEWHGVDISGNMIAYAKQRTADIPNIFLHELPDNSLRIFPDNTFDCVYSSIVFMHLDKLDVFTYMCEAYRVLKPGGRAYFDTYNLLAPQAWQEFVKIVQNFPPGYRPGHVSQFSTPPEIRKFMEEAGFDEIHVDDANPQLVVTLGSKSQSVLSGPPRGFTIPLAPISDDVAVDQGGKAVKTESAGPRMDSTAASGGNDPIVPPARGTDSGTDQQNEYVQHLESELARKNKAISDLERRVRRREAELVAARRPRFPWVRRKP